jgi:predicted RNA-binding Zn-ribbon protein involved in translation (DUF1610 family)
MPEVFKPTQLREEYPDIPILYEEFCFNPLDAQAKADYLHTKETKPVAIPYLDAPTQSYANIWKKIFNIQYSMHLIENNWSPKSSSTTCSSCGSVINTNLYHGMTCPICGEQLPDTEQAEELAKRKQEIHELETKMLECEPTLYFLVVFPARTK